MKLKTSFIIAAGALLLSGLEILQLAGLLILVSMAAFDIAQINARADRSNRANATPGGGRDYRENRKYTLEVRQCR